MCKVEYLCNRKETLRKKTTGGAAIKLGEVLEELIRVNISPKRLEYQQIVETWNRLLPSGLAEHCELSGLSNGQLKVLVDSAPYMYELRLCCTQLLRELRGSCPRAKIAKIKLVLGG